jgi:hypothetical protein
VTIIWRRRVLAFKDFSAHCPSSYDWRRSGYQPDIVSPHVRRHRQNDPQRDPRCPLLFGRILFFCRLGPRSPRAADRGRVLAVDYLYEHADDVTSSQQWRRELSQLKDECDAVPER